MSEMIDKNQIFLLYCVVTKSLYEVEEKEFSPFNREERLHGKDNGGNNW